MKILKELSNGIELDFDIGSASREEILEFAKRLPYYNVVLLRNLDLTKKQLTDIMAIIGKSKSPSQYFNDKEYPDIFHVTNKRDEKGRKLGLFADLELGWHSNGTLRPKVREIILSLYCKQPGEDSITSFCNTREAYEDLPNYIKELVDNIDTKINFHAFTGKIKTIGANDGGYKLTSDDPEHAIFAGKIKGATQHEIVHNVDNSGQEGPIKPLVVQHPWTGQKSLYFQCNFITDWWHRSGQDFDSKGLWDFLFNHLFQEKYIYHHKWKTGDWLWADQWNSFHRRNVVKGERALYRMCCDNHNLLKYLQHEGVVSVSADQQDSGGNHSGTFLPGQETEYEF